MAERRAFRVLDAAGSERLPSRHAQEAEFFFVPIYGECYLYRANMHLGKDGLADTNRW